MEGSGPFNLFVHSPVIEKGDMGVGRLNINMTAVEGEPPSTGPIVQYSEKAYRYAPVEACL